MKVVFLDVDGVLNYFGATEKLPIGTYFVEDDKLQLLKSLIDRTGAEIVLSSSWRSGWSMGVGNDPRERLTVEDSQPYFMLCAKLHEYGLSILSETPRQKNGSREDNIEKWMHEWPGEPVEEYVIIDDEANFFSSDDRHLILTSPQEGLMPEQVEKAVSILNAARKKILLVDDIEVNRGILGAMLEGYYDIVEAEDGHTALNVLKGHDINAVITDIQMPGMGGIDLIKAIREQQEYKNMVIIANTQYGDPDQESRILQAGADEFIYKPSNPNIIKYRIQNAFRLRRL